ncbi:MAG TPA: prepilin peptidase [Blastocatellia bacterium]|nr:prepilin peptidase [Blastocatellia bacterium]
MSYPIFILLLPLTLIIFYFDVKNRRIPNKIVLVALVCGLTIKTFEDGWSGLQSSVAGCLLAFGLMLVLHFFGAMGAGDVKLFGAIGSIIGLGLVLKTFVVVVMLGAVLAMISMIYTGTARITMQRVILILVGFLPGWKMPRYEVTPDRHTIPYGVAIMLGTLISLVIFPS